MFIEKSEASKCQGKERFLKAQKKQREHRFHDAHRTFAVNLQSIGAAHASAAQFTKEAARKQKLNQLLQANNASVASIRAALASCELLKVDLST